ncbi:MAG: VOC family protein [Proteobacteria bacterium]|nr:VOC family protein [Pseudomonadota bacterium]
MTSETDSKPQITHIALKVSDIERAAAFYRTVFGFQQTDFRRDGDHVSCHLTDGTIDLALVEFDPGSVIGGASGEDTCIHHFGIDVDDTAKFAEAIKEAGGELMDDPSRPNASTIKFRVPGGGGIAEIAPKGWHERADGS